MSQRVQVVLPDPVASPAPRARRRRRHTTLDARRTVRRETASPRPPRTARSARCAQPPCSSAATAASDAPWLEPYGGDPDWRQQMWGADRRAARPLPRTSSKRSKTNGGPTNQHVETLCALAVWRAELDDAGQDPRDELAFHTQLTDYAQLLRQKGGGVTKAWKPGAPPPEWAGEVADPTSPTVTSLSRFCVSFASHAHNAARAVYGRPQLHILAPATALTAPAP